MSCELRAKGKASEFDVELGRKVRFARNQGGYTQEDLAAEIGVTFQQLQKYENGSNRISAQRLAMIADTLGVSCAFLMDGGRKSSEADQRDPLLPELLRSWGQIEDSLTKRAILRFIRSVARETSVASTCTTMAGQPRKSTQKTGARKRRA